MRIVALAILASGAVSVSAPARAQAWDPNYPVCLRVYGRINYNDCSYTSLAQCAASASGRAAQCEPNPYFANALQHPSERPHLRYRRAY
jgi:hypothetical protein